VNSPRNIFFYCCIVDSRFAGLAVHFLFTLYYYVRYTGRFIMLSVITNIYNKKTKGPTLMEFFTATGKLEKIFFDN